MILRLSIGSAVLLGIKRYKVFVKPTTIYIMLGERCISHCTFCRQKAGSSDYLSRVKWIKVEAEELLNGLSKCDDYKRICFQTLDYPNIMNDLLDIIPLIKKVSNKPISVSIIPINRKDMMSLKNAGVDTLSIALDAASKEIFNKTKGNIVKNRFTWNEHWQSLKEAKEIFSNVTTHFIVGLGETDEDLVECIHKAGDMGVYPALFAYTPIKGKSALPLERYRAIQMARYLILKGCNNMKFKDEKLIDFCVEDEVIKSIIKEGGVFMTSGCPNCNRPYYNEMPSGPIYNYPYPPDKDVEKELMTYFCTDN